MGWSCDLFSSIGLFEETSGCKPSEAEQETIRQTEAFLAQARAAKEAELKAYNELTKKTIRYGIYIFIISLIIRFLLKR